MNPPRPAELRADAADREPDIHELPTLPRPIPVQRVLARRRSRPRIRMLGHERARMPQPATPAAFVAGGDVWRDRRAVLTSMSADEIDETTWFVDQRRAQLGRWVFAALLAMSAILALALMAQR